jgi:hypothetical protein
MTEDVDGVTFTFTFRQKKEYKQRSGGARVISALFFMTLSLSRREFLAGLAAAPAFVSAYHERISSERKRVKIRDVQSMLMQGPGRNYTLVKITSDAGIAGIAEAYGSPGVGVKEQVLSLKEWLVGKDPLEIDKLYTDMGVGTRSLSGTRTDGSAHNLMRAVSGIEMALWDLAGKILDVPTWTLLGGKFRDKVRDESNRVLTTKELINIRTGFDNCRDAIGWDHDLTVHCHWEYDLRTSIQIAEAVETSKPVRLEDPLPVDYSESWKRLCAASRVPICMGENLARREGFKDFISSRRSASPTSRTCSDCRWPITTPAVRCARMHQHSGPLRFAITWHSKPSPVKATGWTRCCCWMARTSRMASSRRPKSPVWASS